MSLFSVTFDYYKNGKWLTTHDHRTEAADEESAIRRWKRAGYGETRNFKVVNLTEGETKMAAKKRKTRKKGKRMVKVTLLTRVKRAEAVLIGMAGSKAAYLAEAKKHS